MTDQQRPLQKIISQSGKERRVEQGRIRVYVKSLNENELACGCVHRAERNLI